MLPDRDDRRKREPFDMSRDVLFLLEPGFADPKHPGQRFVCPHGLPIEGLLASAPDLAARLDVKRVGFERPRPAVIDALDDAHQGLPVLVLGRDRPAPDDAQTLGDVRFVTDARRILELLAERHGFPALH
ncbi:PF11287 family protein [Burkholderia cenocepacia BC7]|nr:PF11287 family protein [Burkholderia cenocepacia K56-2Valvano]ERI29374.1 PF11287 family protein [Burkholderia cenocepacia BC7]